MATIIEDVALLLGEHLEVVPHGHIQVEHGVITSAGVGESHGHPVKAVRFNGHGLLAIPGLIDAHTHIADSIAADVGVGSSLDELVHPISGLKTKLLKATPEQQIWEAIAHTGECMLASGITTFADFREGGLAGVQLARKALASVRSRSLLLGRPNYHFDKPDVRTETEPLPREAADELVETIETCSGLGVSGANEYTGEAMKEISELTTKKGKLLGVHAAESVESRKASVERFSEGEVQRVLRYMCPSFLVHLTNASSEDLKLVAERKIPVVCCPRANSILGLGFPPILNLLRSGVTVALGTDNAMLAGPDMFREMDYASRALRADGRDAGAVDSKEVLKMATVNAAKVLGLGSRLGSIESGKRADILFLNSAGYNLRYSRDWVGSVVHRARPEDIECVMVDGEVVHGSISRD